MVRVHFRNSHPSLSAWLDTLDRRLVTVFDGEHSALLDAGTTIIGSRGKRLRPVLLLLSCACFGEVTDRAITQAALVELIHAASLAHDDVLDEAEFRRSEPSAPSRWGNKLSIILGDYIFARVFEYTIADGDLAIARLLAAATAEMGRAISLEMTGLDINTTEASYLWVVRGKTAALFSAATAIGARIGGADAAQQQAMERLGEAFGMSFQLADDLLDLQGSEDDAGKPLGVDWRQRRATLPLIRALRTASPQDAATIRTLWRHDPFTDEQLQALREMVRRYDGFNYGWQKVNEYRERASACLAGVPVGAGRTALEQLLGETFPLPVLPGIA